MNTKSFAIVSDSELRKMANEALHKKPPSRLLLKTENLAELVHELQVHQIELEMQNEELRAAHLELAASRDQFAELYDFAPVGYLTLDTDTCIVGANHAAGRMLGLERTAINSGKLKFSHVVDRDCQDKWFLFSRTFFNGEEKLRCELTLRSEKNKKLTVLLECIAVRGESGILDRCMVALIDVTERNKMEAELETYRRGLEDLVEQRTGELSTSNAMLEADITERKRIEEALRKSEQRLKFHFENSPLAVVEWDANFVVTQWSTEATRMFSWKKEETLGRQINALKLVFAEDVSIVTNAINRLISGKVLTLVSTNRNCTKSGSIIKCMWFYSVLLDQNGKIESVVSLVQDITEREWDKSQMEATLVGLNQSNRELTNSNRLSVDRDQRIIEMKKEVNELCKRLGEPLRYDKI